MILRNYLGWSEINWDNLQNRSKKMLKIIFQEIKISLHQINFSISCKLSCSFCSSMNHIDQCRSLVLASHYTSHHTCFCKAFSSIILQVFLKKIMILIYYLKNYLPRQNKNLCIHEDSFGTKIPRDDCTQNFYLSKFHKWNIRS